MDWIQLLTHPLFPVTTCSDNVCWHDADFVSTPIFMITLGGIFLGLFFYFERGINEPPLE